MIYKTWLTTSCDNRAFTFSLDAWELRVESWEWGENAEWKSSRLRLGRGRLVVSTQTYFTGASSWLGRMICAIPPQGFAVGLCNTWTMGSLIIRLTSRAVHSRLQSQVKPEVQFVAGRRNRTHSKYMHNVLHYFLKPYLKARYTRVIRGLSPYR